MSLLAASLLAAEEPASSAAGPLGLLIVVLLGVSLVLLIRNMDRRIKRLPREFPEDGHGRPQRGAGPDEPGAPQG